MQPPPHGVSPGPLDHSHPWLTPWGTSGERLQPLISPRILKLLHFCQELQEGPTTNLRYPSVHPSLHSTTRNSYPFWALTLCLNRFFGSVFRHVLKES